MSVEIRIIHPATTDPIELRSVIAMLQEFVAAATPYAAGGNPSTMPPVIEEGKHGSVVREAEETATVSPEAFAALVPTPPAPHLKVSLPGVTSRDQAAASAFAPPAPAPIVLPLAPPATGAFDKDNLPWDGRIHATTKTKTVEGVWKKKRGVEQAEVDRVVAELQAAQMAPESRPEPAAATTPEVPVFTLVPPPPLASSAASPIVPPAPPAPPVGISFPAFMSHVTAGVTSQRFTREDVAEACVKSGVPNLPGLINRPDLIPAVARELGLMI